MAHESQNHKMIAWLQGKPAPMVHAVAGKLNWGFAKVTIEYIAVQSSTDRATAARLFFMSCPSNAFPVKMADGYAHANHGLDAGTSVRALISSMWQGNYYATGGVAYDPRKANEGPLFLELIEGEKKFRPTGLLPWPVMQGIEGPFHGEPQDNLDFHDDDDYWRMAALFADLGTMFPGTYHNHSEHHKYLDWRSNNGFSENPT